MVAYGKVSAKEAMYILGKALWQLWTGKHPRATDQLTEDIPEPVHSIIRECCIDVEPVCSNIEELRVKYVLKAALV